MALLTACSSGSPAGTASGPKGSDAAPLKVMASSYPRQYVTEPAGGDLVTVESLRPPGIEPHDLELSGASVASREGAAAVVYLSGFQPPALMIVPAAVPQLSARSFRASMTTAMIIGATIVVLAIGPYALVAIACPLLKRPERARDPRLDAEDDVRLREGA
jgi:hypothetical protein